MTSDLIASSSPITDQPKDLRYDVFLNFRGEDTRNQFVSPLHEVFTRIERVESLLCLDVSDVSVVGIWGMGGIGKTTIARAVFGRIQECSKGKLDFDDRRIDFDDWRSHLKEVANISCCDSHVTRGGVEGNNNNRSSCVAFISPPHLENMKTETAASVKEAPAVPISTPNSATLNLGFHRFVISHAILAGELTAIINRCKVIADEEIIMLLAKLPVTGSSFQDSIQIRRQSRNTSKQDLNTKSKHSSRNLDDATKDLMMAKILGAAGALRGRDVAAKKLQESNREAHLESRKPPRFAFQHHSTLVAATLLVTMTFLAALRPSSELLKVERINGSQTGKQGTPITDLFVLFNSTAFISLIVLIFSITQKLSVQPLFLFVEFSIVGAYVCSVMVVTPHLVAAVLLIGGFILLVACFKFLGFHKMVLKWLQWPCTKVQSERKSTAPDAYLPLVSNTH